MRTHRLQRLATLTSAGLLALTVLAPAGLAAATARRETLTVWNATGSRRSPVPNLDVTMAPAAGDSYFQFSSDGHGNYFDTGTLNGCSSTTQQTATLTDALPTARRGARTRLQVVAFGQLTPATAYTTGSERLWPVGHGARILVRTVRVRLEVKLPALGQTVQFTAAKTWDASEPGCARMRSTFVTALRDSAASVQVLRPAWPHATPLAFADSR